MADELDVRTFVGEVIIPTITRDNYLFIVLGGRMGGGKSTFAINTAQEYCRQMGIPFNLETSITWQRKELIEWIDGTNRKQEFSVIIVDELISLFFNRNFSDKGQKQAIELLNKCRDRHLLIIGCIPNFWELDRCIRDLTSIYCFNYQRGLAIAFQPYDNGFVYTGVSVSEQGSKSCQRQKVITVVLKV
jgi:hypothetical protein